jgi:heat shock protein HslJ
MSGWSPGTGSAVTLRFAGGQASGSDGCNRYTLRYQAQGRTLEFPGPAAGTRMACPPEVMRQAEAYLAALGATQAYRIDGDRLQLLAADGIVRATFAAQAQALAGTRWRATAIHDGRGAVASLVAGSTVTIAFGPDGRASGTAGCNRFNAGYQTEGLQLRFMAPAATRMMCAQPGVMEQEQQFLKVLERVATARFEADRLELRDAQGALMVALARE